MSAAGSGDAVQAAATLLSTGTESFLKGLSKERALDRQHQLAVLQARGGGTVARGGGTVARGGAGSADIAGEKYRGGGDPSGIMEDDAEVRAVNAVSGGGGGGGGGGGDGGGDGFAQLAALILAGQEMMQAGQEKTLGARACARAGVLCARSCCALRDGAVNELCGLLKDFKRHRDEDDCGTDGNGGGRPRLRPRSSK